jgi:MoaA/NifB/PqqE/SkfB family radical SAM enzyme
VRISLPVARVWAGNLWRARVLRRSFLRPLGVTWQATNACNFRCHYCDDGRGNRYPDLGGRTMSTAEVQQVLSLAREAVEMLYITGGEPLLRNDMAAIVRWAKREAGFSYVGLATNGVLLERHELMLGDLDEMEISLDSIDEAHYDTVLNAGDGMARAVREAVVRYHEAAGRHGYRFSVTCVARPGRIADARQVVRFCSERGVRCGILPQARGPYPEPTLGLDPEYAPFIDEVVAAKRRGAPIYGSYRYYAHIRDFRPFRCYPTLAPRILPNGDLAYPCAPLGHAAGNLVGARSFLEVLQAGRAALGPVPACDARCFASCYIETSACISAPLSAALEHIDIRTSLRHMAGRLGRTINGRGNAGQR